jgi:hypothetical protein
MHKKKRKKEQPRKRHSFHNNNYSIHNVHLRDILLYQMMMMTKVVRTLS